MASSTAVTTGLPVDWAVAAQVAGRLVRPGRTGGRDEMAELVADLHRAARAATGHVMHVTGMTPVGAIGGPATEDGAPGDADGPISRVVVVDRAAWARANTEMLEALTRDVPLEPRGRPASAATRAAGALQVGGVLALLAGRVLGQFDPFTPTPGARGRLLLVAPNVFRLERELDLDGHDFRLWVALHEQTHALQFAAAPWLGGHLRGRLGRLLAGFADADGHLADDAGRAFAAGLARAARGRGAAVGPEVLLPPDGRRVFEEVGAVMALLEGHADVAMDAVGRGVVPSVRQIRTRFDRRRATDRGAVDRVLRRMLGMELKLAQYRDGATFVRRVRRRVGQDGLNAVWSEPANLPTAAEITEPAAWVRRVHG